MLAGVGRCRHVAVEIQRSSRKLCQGIRLVHYSPTASKHSQDLEFSSALPSNKYFKVSEEIEDAILQKKPVVALETTIYTHGWPYPDNLDLAKHLESIVRSHGAIPATIGILDGVATVGMSDREMQALLDPASKAIKLSRRDLAYAVSQKLSGGTTIATTMMLARMARIDVFATGGLGGVHRGAEVSMDVSADLTELGRTARPVAVIAGGCKGFLDIPRTLEVLETQGAVVATFADGRAHPVDFPAFWVRDSGIKSPLTIRNEAEAAALMRESSSDRIISIFDLLSTDAQILLRTQSSVFFAGPVPEAASIPMPEMEDMISQALRMADEQRVYGSANTPFVLKKLKELSNGRSVIANKALVEANVKRGALTAVELSRLLSADRGEDMYPSQF